MNIILFTNARGRPSSLNLGQPRFVAAFLLSFLVFAGGLLYGGYRLGATSATTMTQATGPSQWRSVMEKQGQAVAETRRVAQANLDALALRLGQMQAQIMRIDALGQQLTKMANLDQGEFNFDQVPGQGGPENPADLQPTDLPDFMQSLDALSAQIKSREQQLTVLQALLMNRNLHRQVQPTGRPVRSGWISSYFGMRTDPFNGKREFHPGIDFAGKEGTPVMAVAAGVVTWAGPRFGYGNLVQINHGNGIATRYGHNEKVLVKVGQRVAKGQRIALMGSTGRSTGPHVHFEVLKDGHAVNPLQYVRASADGR